MRTLALVRLRLRGALRGRVLLAPLVTLAGVQLLGLAGGRQPASVLMVASTFLALPVLGWAARNVLDAVPPDQALLDRLAVGGPVPETLAGLLAAAAVTLPLGVLCAYGSLVQVADTGAPRDVLLRAGALALATAPVAVATGSLAARGISGSGSAPVVVLVAVPLLVVVLGLSHSPVVSGLVPHLDAAVRATDPPPGALCHTPAGTLGECTPDVWFVPRAPAIVLQVLAWDVVVLGLRLAWAART